MLIGAVNECTVALLARMRVTIEDRRPPGRCDSSGPHGRADAEAIMAIGRATVATALLFAALASLMALAGCSSSAATGWDFEKPPATGSTVANADAGLIARPVLVISPFANPASSSVPWPNLGRNMSEALSRALLADGRYNILVMPEVSAKIDPIVANLLKGDQSGALAKVREAYPNVDYVITGKVTDFHHLADLNKDMSRSGWFGKKNEALVAIKLNIVDLTAKRVIAVDHIYGAAGAGETPAKDLYRGMDLDSYLFWSTPLGRATNQVINKAELQIATLVPDTLGREIVVSGFIEPRTVEIAAGKDHGLEAQQVLFLCLPPALDGRAEALLDPATRQPIMVKILQVQGTRSQGIMLGKPPADVELRGTVLLRQQAGEGARQAVAGSER
jgi:curli biogenesis system outer membrane secretion channel CsgG